MGNVPTDAAQANEATVASPEGIRELGMLAERTLGLADRVLALTARFDQAEQRISTLEPEGTAAAQADPYAADKAKSRDDLARRRRELAEQTVPKVAPLEAALKHVHLLVQEITNQSCTVQEIIGQAEVSGGIRDDEERRAKDLLALHHKAAELFVTYLATEDLDRYHLSASTARTLAHQVMGTDELAFAVRTAEDNR
jgi:hypothetical protein